MAIEAGKTQTFTISSVPKRPAQQKTIQRLMRMQPDIQRGLKKLARQRDIKDNVKYVRAGRPWISRARTTKLTQVEKGESFTLLVTPQIVNDLQSVEKFLAVK